MTLPAFYVSFTFETGLFSGTTQLMGTFIVLTNEEAESQIKAIIKDTNSKHYPYNITRDHFKKNTAYIEGGILFDSLLETHPERFI